LDPALAKRVREEAVENYLADNTQAWELKADGSYERIVPAGNMPHTAQTALLAKLCG
jgi:polyphosphate kinase